MGFKTGSDSLTTSHGKIFLGTMPFTKLLSMTQMLDMSVYYV
jgi:hypothetical protein